MKVPDVSIVIPLYNEAENLPALAEQIRAAMKSVEQSYEVVLVDDGSSDGSLEVMRQLAAKDSRLRLVHLYRNSGQSAALSAGFDAARGKVIVTLDADLQNDPADVPLLLAELRDCDMVAGVRSRRQDSWVRRMSSRVANGVRRRVLHDAATDTGCSLKAFRTDAVRDLPRFVGMHRFLPALVQLAGGSVKQVAVNHRPRLHGSPKYNIRNRLWRGVVDLLGVYWLQRRWIDRRLAGEVKVWPATRSGAPGSSSPGSPSSGPASTSRGPSPQENNRR